MPSVEACCTNMRIQQRWVFAFMGFLAFVNAYAMRVCLSMTITEMAIPINDTKEFIDQTCPPLPDNATGDATETSGSGGNYDWSEYTQGIILSSFYVGCVITHLPGGMISEKFGGKYSLAMSILISGICSLASPIGVHWGGSSALIVLRVIMGLACGVLYPAANVMLSSWIPLEERSRAGSFVFAGAPLGTAFANTVSGLLMKYTGGWPSVFYFFGTLGVVWFLLFMVLCYNSPAEHPFVSKDEASYLRKELSEHKHEKPPSVPWARIAKSKAVFATLMAMIGHACGFLTLISDLPKYMSSVLKFNIQDNGYLSSLPYLCMWLSSTITSKIFDWLIAESWASPTTVRKIGVTVSSMGPAIFLIAASYAGCDRLLVIVFFTLAMTLMGCSLPSARINLLDLSPNYAGSLMAFTNGVSACTGIVTPYVVGLLTPEQTLKQWRRVFWIIFCVFALTNAIYLCYGSGKVQKWNDPEFLKRESQRKKDAKAAKEATDLLPKN